jgi:hypothetical protein
METSASAGHDVAPTTIFSRSTLLRHSSQPEFTPQSFLFLGAFELANIIRVSEYFNNTVCA